MGRSRARARDPARAKRTRMNGSDLERNIDQFERVDADIAASARQRAGRALVMRGTRLQVTGDDAAPTFVACEPTEVDPAMPFLGIDETGAPLYVHLLASDSRLDDATRLSDLRMELGRYAPAMREAIVTALALARWSRSASYCGACGRDLVWEIGGRTKRCTREPEPHRHFPRTDPATIMLVHDGNRALLGRQATWPSGLYSTLAGFVEVGETAESAVAREVFEEVGVRVDDIRYSGSEAWPFPRSLMLGYSARATTYDIRIGDELEDARWFTRDELRDVQAHMTASMPHFDTIARRLMAAWIAKE
jgi:NAD+ diphosphatase